MKNFLSGWNAPQLDIGLPLVIFGAIAFCGSGKYSLASAIGRKEFS